MQQSETQDWPESTTDRIIWLKQLHNSAMLAPSRWRVSTTVYLHAQFCRLIRSQRLSANTDFKEGLALHMSKVKKSKGFFITLFFVSTCIFCQRSAPYRNHRRSRRKRMPYIIHLEKSRPRSPSVSYTVEVCSSLHRHTGGDSSSSQYRKRINVA